MKLSTFNRYIKVWTIAILVVWIPLSVVLTIKAIKFIANGPEKEFVSSGACEVSGLKLGSEVKIGNEIWHVTENDLLESIKVMDIQIKGDSPYN